MTIENNGQPDQPTALTEDSTGDELLDAMPAHARRRRPIVAISIATAAVVLIGGLGTAGVALLTRPSTTTTSIQSTQAQSTQPRSPYRFGPQNGQQGSPLQQGQSQQGTASNESQATAATAAEKVGIVTINTVLDYTSEDQAAGTGMILSSDGLILTNNHVVEGSTSIKVTVESTDKTYTAKVVGTDQKADVAVLQLADASGLSPISFAPAATVTTGQSVYSVGNAEGTGNLVTAAGTVGATNQSLTIQGDSATKAENLSGLIELDSDIVSGDSGGPLFNSSGKVIGIVTAASSGTATVTGYAINIASVLKIADQIEAGTATSDIVIGTPAFLGIELATATQTDVGGVAVSGAFAGMPAAAAGIKSGSVILSVDGTKVTTAAQLSALIASHKPGDRVVIAWTGASGASHTATATLVAGPAA